jgi:dihydrofolate reductase
VHPIVLGSGKRLFEDGAPTTLELVGSQELGSGIVLLTYRA